MTLDGPPPPWASESWSEKQDNWTRSEPDSLMSGVKDPQKSCEEFCVHVNMTMFLKCGTIG